MYVKPWSGVLDEFARRRRARSADPSGSPTTGIIHSSGPTCRTDHAVLGSLSCRGRLAGPR
jgi:hypothetical protein